MTLQSNSIGSVLGSRLENAFLSQLLDSEVESYKPDKSYKMIVFWGGEDIWTGYYGEEPHKTTAIYESPRDRLEKEIFNANPHTPKLGICRGAQLLCALSGGKLWQHVDKHTNSHLIKLEKDNSFIPVTSTHHQMMRPTPQMRLLAASSYVRSPHKWNENKDPYLSVDPEAEIVFIPETKALCIQGHPEYTTVNSPFSKLTTQLVKEHLL